jgi:hypothetical protein
MANEGTVLKIVLMFFLFLFGLFLFGYSETTYMPFGKYVIPVSHTPFSGIGILVMFVASAGFVYYLAELKRISNEA